MINCKICGARLVKKVGEYRNWVWQGISIFNNKEIAVCDGCGFGYVEQPPSANELLKFYSRIYRSSEGSHFIDFKNKPLGVVNGTFLRAYAQISLGLRFCHFYEGEIFVDVGPGDGASFRAADELLNNPQKFAVELSDGAKDFYSKYFNTASLTSLLEIENRRKAKIILLSHSLEHYTIEGAEELLVAIRSSLHRNGILIVEVPNVDLRSNAEVRGTDAPHMLFFSQESLGRLFANIGFEILFSDTCSKPFDRTNCEKYSQKAFESKVKNVAGRKFKNYIKASWVGGGLRQINARLRRATNLSDRPGLETFCYSGDRVNLRIVARRVS